ncbi:MAG: HAD-IA family hydrolase [Sinimarinibacterium sp.]
MPQLSRTRPRVVLFDWHATLVDTMDAMYHALDDVIPRLVELDLIGRLVPPDRSKTAEDARLVQYVRENVRLHPKIKIERKISRTDIFEVLFGVDEEAKTIAHREFDRCYGRVFGAVRSLEADVPARLRQLREMGARLGVLSNRSRQFMAHEIYMVDGVGWHELFDTIVCGDDVARRKPHPDLILKALDNLGCAVGEDCWYVGDSTTDVVAAKQAGVTAVFYNGAGWERSWIDKIFPGTPRHPHVPDAVIADLGELVGLVGRARYHAVPGDERMHER